MKRGGIYSILNYIGGEKIEKGTKMKKFTKILLIGCLLVMVSCNNYKNTCISDYSKQLDCITGFCRTEQCGQS